MNASHREAVSAACDVAGNRTSTEGIFCGNLRMAAAGNCSSYYFVRTSGVVKLCAQPWAVSYTHLTLPTICSV